VKVVSLESDDPPLADRTINVVRRNGSQIVAVNVWYIISNN